jgi:hypothetical protein
MDLEFLTMIPREAKKLTILCDEFRSASFLFRKNPFSWKVERRH